MTIERDERWPKGLDKRRSFLLYVSDENQLLLEELLERIPRSQAGSLSASIFVAITKFISAYDRDELGMLPSEANLSMQNFLYELGKALYALGKDEEEAATLIKPVLLAQGLLSLEMSYATYSLFGERKEFPWALVKGGIEELLSEADKYSFRDHARALTRLTKPASVGAWKALVEEMARSSEHFADPLGTLEEMQEALDWLKEQFEGKDTE